MLVNGTGDSIGFDTADSIFVSDVPNGFPLVDYSGIPQPPRGFAVPRDAYTIQLSAPEDSAVYVMSFEDSSVVSVGRNDAAPGESDRMFYDGGLGLTNIGGSERSYVFSWSLDEAIGRSKVVDISSLETPLGDSPVFHRGEPG